MKLNKGLKRKYQQYKKGLDVIESSNKKMSLDRNFKQKEKTTKLIQSSTTKRKSVKEVQATPCAKLVFLLMGDSLRILRLS